LNDLNESKEQTAMRPRSLPLPSRTAGFSLAELMVAVVIGLLILAGLTTMFVKNSRAQTRVERANRQIENGRYAVDVLATDLRNAGYYAEYDPTELALPASLPDPCAVALADLKLALPLHVQGIDAGMDLPSCLSDVKSGSDVLVVRHVRACAKGDANCDADDPDGPLFQASLCNNASELGSGAASDHFALAVDTTQLTRHKRDCGQAAGTGTLAAKRRFLTHLYYVANNDNAGDGIPTLKRAELRLVNGALQFVSVPLAEGITSLQLEYGMDTSTPTDGVVDLVTATPGTALGCASPDCAVRNWNNVLSVRLALLATNGDTGANAKTQTFQSLILMPNPTGRKQP
jgi:type IV pilus assembly protein PilW